MPSHRVERVLPYTAEQLFDLAADVERYPDFLPWWVGARVVKRDGDVYYTDQIVRFGIVRQRFSSKTALRRPERIDVTSNDRPFKDFHLTWSFDPLPDGGCRVALAIDLELRSRLFHELFAQALVQAAGRIISAFEARARRLHGSGRANS
ncbi:MAG: type II toxin-antitoxin system RatA family toxin [Kiloniellaceae bacterium]